MYFLEVGTQLDIAFVCDKFCILQCYEILMRTVSVFTTACIHVTNINDAWETIGMQAVSVTAVAIKHKLTGESECKS